MMFAPDVHKQVIEPVSGVDSRLVPLRLSDGADERDGGEDITLDRLDRFLLPTHAAILWTAMSDMPPEDLLRGPVTLP
jgi:hypothetical protein